MSQKGSIDEAEARRRFGLHDPGPELTAKLDDAQRAYEKFAVELALVLPESREKSLAFTALEESVFWALTAIARLGTLVER